MSPKVKAALRRRRGSRSVRKWSFNGLPSPRQICHLRLLGGSPRAVHLLITGLQRLPPASCPSAAPGRRLAPFSRGGAEASAWPELPARGPPLPAPASPHPCWGDLWDRGGSQAGGSLQGGAGLEGHALLFLRTLYTSYFTNRIVYCLHNYCTFFFPFI